MTRPLGYFIEPYRVSCDTLLLCKSFNSTRGIRSHYPLIRESAFYFWVCSARTNKFSISQTRFDAPLRINNIAVLDLYVTCPGLWLNISLPPLLRYLLVYRRRPFFHLSYVKLSGTLNS